MMYDGCLARTTVGDLAFVCEDYFSSRVRKDQGFAFAGGVHFHSGCLFKGRGLWIGLRRATGITRSQSGSDCPTKNVPSMALLPKPMKTDEFHSSPPSKDTDSWLTKVGYWTLKPSIYLVCFTYKAIFAGCSSKIRWSVNQRELMPTHLAYIILFSYFCGAHKNSAFCYYIFSHNSFDMWGLLHVWI